SRCSCCVAAAPLFVGPFAFPPRGRSRLRGLRYADMWSRAFRPAPGCDSVRGPFLDCCSMPRTAADARTPRPCIEPACNAPKPIASVLYEYGAEVVDVGKRGPGDHRVAARAEESVRIVVVQHF